MQTVLRKVTRRQIPFMLLLYVVAYLDRVNVGFAALQMNEDLGFSAAVYGFGAGIFFIGYFLFEVPSNLILERVGARRWIARIMVSWGIVSTGMMLVSGPISFYALRFLLGVTEAGFFPGMILYLTYWFPAAERGRAVARFMTATAMAGVIGGPLSGALLGMHGLWGLAGWQWLFLIEGLPAIILGAAAYYYLTDGPEKAHWLTLEERTWLSARLEAERERKERRGRYTLRQALSNLNVWLLAIVYFSVIMSFYGVSFWLPQLVKGFSGMNDFMVGILSAVPYLVASAGMVVIAAHSDRTGERKWHVAAPAFTGAVGLLLSAYLTSPVPSLLALSLAALGIWGALGPFWTLPTSFLSGTAAAGGIALINSVGNLGGFVGPTLVGWMRDATNSFSGGMLVLAIGLVACGFLVLRIRHDETLEDV